jgi:glycosyltransferase involved in cell wall biosynthesis
MAIRVLHVISGLDPQNGGPSVALQGMVAAQRAAGIDARVIATWRERTGLVGAERFETAGIPVQMVGRAIGKLSWHVSLPRVLRAAAREADVVHVHGVWEEIQYQACRAARRVRRPFVLTPHGMLSGWNMRRTARFKRAYMALRLRRQLNAAARLHFTTDAERDSVAALGLRPPPLVERLGIDLSEFDPLPPAGAFRAKYPQLAGRTVVIHLGRIDYKKGLDLLVPSFAASVGPPGTPPPWLVLAGPDNDGYGREIRALCEKHGVAGRVLFTGMLHGRERVEALVDADLFALTSYTENFGVAVVEALAAGVPVLISDQVNVAETLAGRDVGEVVPLDVPRIAASLSAWLAVPARRRAAGERARSLVHAEFAWPAIARRWVRHYETIAGLAPASQAGGG